MNRNAGGLVGELFEFVKKWVFGGFRFVGDFSSETCLGFDCDCYYLKFYFKTCVI